MPVIENSTYRPPLFLRNCHLQTVLPSLFRKVPGINYRRERIDTPDGDFLDLDHSLVGSDRAVLLSHGLEGDSGRAYMKGMARAFNARGWDSVSLNFRGCSGEPNRTPRTYHSGKTEDIHRAVEHLLSAGNYRSLSLVGFSLGGNCTLKYVGEQGAGIFPEIKSAVAISAPCDLSSSARELHRVKNYFYSKRFLITLVEKMRAREPLLPPGISRDFSSVKTLRDFDDRFTGPLNGFRDAAEYWEKCSARNFMAAVAVPTLVLSAADDPFLGERCYPYEEARASGTLFLEVPGHGGHCGFIAFGNDGEFWHETRAAAFAEEHR